MSDYMITYNCPECRKLLAKVARLECKLRKAKPAGRVLAKCRWTDDGDGNWSTGCGELWSFIDGGPKENGVRHCLLCGKRVEAREAKGGGE